MKLYIKIFTALLVFSLFVSCGTARKTVLTDTDSLRIGFYNVENLYDTVDDPLTGDDEFTPGSKKAWTPERYRTKLTQLAKVVEGMGFPALLGLAEVENATVVTDFCEKTSLAAQGYSFVHFDSPDERGIDVAFLYQKKYFKVLAAKPLSIQFPDGVAVGDPNPATRDILAVVGILPQNDTIHVFVVHAPSRSGGQKESEPKRIYVAQQLRREVDEIFSKKPSAGIVIMGDFNDEPGDASIAQTLGALSVDENPQPGRLYNCFAKLHAGGKGSYNYRGNWNMLDQVILSGHLIQRAKGLRFKEAQVFRQDWMLYTDPKNGPAPNRTYGGDRYFGGFSDHLPVMVILGK